jgi:hypothetical protein
MPASGSRPGSRGTTPKGKEREVLPEHPGAGTLFVHRSYSESGASSSKWEQGSYDWDELVKVGRRSFPARGKTC